MKLSINWLKELVDLKMPIEELIRLLPLRTIGLKDITKDYIELDMKGYNRADLLSLRGIALEIAAITDSKIKFNEKEENLRSDLPTVRVTVTNPTLTPVYCIAKIENLKVEHSNDTWVKKLNDSGIRSVNNLADVTNLIMLEYGQPLHAFDAAGVKDETIIVRTAKANETLVTLDGKLRKLTPSDLLITDPEKPLGLAGVMGGRNSEVSETTSAVLLEAAVFDPFLLRKTTARLGLQSEASKRFYHGLTKKRLLQALSAAIKMYESIGGKLTALSVVDHLNQPPVTLALTQQKINSLIGVRIPPKQVENSLAALGFKLAVKDPKNQVWDVTVPYWRLDIEIEEDLIEEVARMYGYEKIPAKLLDTNIPNIAPNPLFDLLDSLKQVLSKAGLTEVQTYSFYSMNVISNLKCQMSNLIRIANPISSETEYLRDNLWPNLVEVAAKNARSGFKDVAIFEIGKIYYRNESNEASEKYSLSIALMNNTDNPLAQLYNLFNKLNKDLNLKIEQTDKEKEGNIGFFHPNRLIQLSYNNKIIGGLAEVHKRITDKFGISQRVAVLEIGLTKLL